MKIEFGIILSNNFPQIDNKDTSRYFSINCSSSFLWTGTILHFFKQQENVQPQDSSRRVK